LSLLSARETEGQPPSDLNGAAEPSEHLSIMFPSKLALPAAWLLLLAAASAAPASDTVDSQKAAAAAAVPDTAAGTGTGAAQPVPTNEKGAGAFAVCHNTDGIFKPFCLPKHKEIYYPGSMHYGKPSPSSPPHPPTLPLTHHAKQ
jgi:hypothetical protein